MTQLRFVGRNKTMELVKESFYNVEYKLSSSMTSCVRVVAGNIENAIKAFNERWSSYEIVKVEFVGYIYRLP